MPILLDHQLREQIPLDIQAFPIAFYCDELAALPNRAGPVHWHPYFEIATAQSGVLDYQVGQAHTILEPGDSIFVNQNMLHGIRQLSGIGGQLDFLEGAYRSKGGKGFVCLNATHKKKDGTLKSNIVPYIAGGSTVSAPRTMIQYVATEYGIAKLSGKTLRERAEAMVAISHPDFRDELLQYAQDNFF